MQNSPVVTYTVNNIIQSFGIIILWYHCSYKVLEAVWVSLINEFTSSMKHN